jgi:hypothetical protein
MILLIPFAVILAVYSAVSVRDARRALQRVLDLNCRLMEQVEAYQAAISGLAGAAETLERIVEEAKKRAGE